MSPHILARHPDFIVTAKPAGLSFHAEEGENGFVATIKTLSACPDLHPVHRLDRITSGLTLFATNAAAAREFSRMFEAGEIAKYYLALSDRKPGKKQGAIKGQMCKGRGGNWRLGTTGPLAVTQFFSFGLGAGRRLFVVRPRTGRTHQIRVALKSLGAPILGDVRYGGTESDRGYLHAFVLQFIWKGEPQRFEFLPEAGTDFTAETLLAKLAEIGPVEALPWPEQGLTRRPDNG